MTLPALLHTMDVGSGAECMTHSMVPISPNLADCSFSLEILGGPEVRIVRALREVMLFLIKHPAPLVIVHDLQDLDKE